MLLDQRKDKATSQYSTSKHGSIMWWTDNIYKLYNIYRIKFLIYERLEAKVAKEILLICFISTTFINV